MEIHLPKQMKSIQLKNSQSLKNVKQKPSHGLFAQDCLDITTISCSSSAEPQDD
jgi:hypothetical protein